MNNADQTGISGGPNLGGLIENGIENWKSDELKEFNRYFRDATCLRREVKRVNGKLGNGQNSVVFWGIQFGTEKAITIKVDLRPLDRAKNYDDIKEKINALKAMHYQDIADLIAFIPDPQYRWSYILMEYIYGTDLNRILRDEGPIQPDIALNWGCQILRALDYLHTKNHIHGNIRASNIVRRADGTVCLCDFSYHIDDSSTMRQPGDNNPDLPFNSGVSIFGTIQDKDRLRQEQQNDLYWLGFLIYRLMTGRGFHEEESFESQFNRLKNASNKVVAETVMRALGDRTKRYSNAKEMLDAFYSMPYRDSAIKKGRVSFILAAYIATMLIFIGAGMNWIGQYKIDRVDTMLKKADSAQIAIAEADYTSALQSALDSVTAQSALDPACPPKSQKVLSDILGAYDLAPGYKPLYSVGENELGESILEDVLLSPKGTWIAVIKQEMALSFWPEYQIHILDAKNGKTKYVIPASSSCVNFLDENSLLYLGEGGLSVLYINGGEAVALSGSSSLQAPNMYFPGLKIAVSSDRSTIAAIYGNPDPWFDSQQTVYIYKKSIEESGDWQPNMISLKFNEIISSPDLSTLQQFGADSTMLALNKDGTCLAVSLPDGSLRVCALDRQGSLSAFDEIYPTVPNGSTIGFMHFEGGFYDDFFFYSATRNQGNGVESLWALYKIKLSPAGDSINLVSRETDPEYVEMHADVGEDGIFFSKGNSIWRYTKDQSYCTPIINNIEGTVTALRHISGFDSSDGGKFLAVLDGTRILLGKDIYDPQREDTHYSWNDAFVLKNFSANHTALVVQDDHRLSVLCWEDPWKDKNVNIISYDPSYENHHFSVRGDEKSAMFFGETKPYFKIFYSDGSVYEPEPNSMGEGVFLTRYLRSDVTLDGSNEECLAVFYLGNRVCCYSAADGREIELKNEAEFFPPFLIGSWETDSYFISYGVDQKLAITGKTANQSKQLTINGQLEDATEYGGYLVLSIAEDRSVVKSQILDQNLECIAEIPGSCMVLENGHLYFNDRQGHLIQTKIYSLEELQARANERMKLLLDE